MLFTKMLLAATPLFLLGVAPLSADEVSTHPAPMDTLHTGLAEREAQLGEVMVSVQKRRQTAIEVPVTVSALTGRNIERLQLKGMDEMSAFIPGLEVQIQSPNNPGYVIRGVTSDGGESYAQPRISVFTDGVSTSRSRASVAELFDMERVEVVKGPQGTLFGRGAEIGAMHLLRQRAKTDRTAGELSLNYGTHNQRGAQGMINTPFSSRAANRFAFSYDAHDGFIRNTEGGRLNGKNTIALRNSTRWMPTDRTTMDLVLDYQHDNAPGTSFKSQRIPALGGSTSPYTAASLNGGDELGIKRHVGGLTFLLDQRLSEGWKLSATTGFRAFKSDEKFDADGTYLPLLDCREEADGTQFSQELRLHYDRGNRFSGFVGAGYFFENSKQRSTVSTNLQYLFPAYIGRQFNSLYKPQFEGIVAGLPALGEALKQQYPPAYASAIDKVISDLQQAMGAYVEQWFPAQYDPTQAVGNTPDFYGDLDAMLKAYIAANPAVGMVLGQNASLDAILTMAGLDPATLKAQSNLPLAESQSEEGTNYGRNQAVEVFADGTYHLWKGLSLTAGLRGTYENQRSGYSSSTVPNPVFGAIQFQPTVGNQTVYMSDNYYSWVGRVALNYLFGRNNAYVSVSRGRRPGVLYFNNSPEKQERLKPEIIVSYEAGLKGNVFSGRLGYEVAAYYYDWSHFQTTRLDEASSTIARNYIADDAGRAHTFGLELGLRYAPCRFVNLFGNYGYIDGKFNDEDENGNAQEYAGNRFRLTPKHTFSFGVDFDMPLKGATAIYLRPTYSYKSKVYFEDDNSEALSQEGYGILNFTAGVRFSARKLRFDVGAYGKNVLDEQYLIDAGNTGNTIGFPTYVAGSPSRFGLQVKMSF